MTRASKILGKCLFDKLWSISPQLANAKCGFRKGRFCVLQLLVSLRSIYQGIDSRKATHILYPDSEKAVEKIEDACSLKKLVSFGVRCYLLKLIESNLSDCYQRVTIEGCSSSLMVATSGVPQGSLVGPPFTLVYINSLPEYLSLTQAACFILADDTKLLA